MSDLEKATQKVLANLNMTDAEIREAVRPTGKDKLSVQLQTGDYLAGRRDAINEFLEILKEKSDCCGKPECVPYYDSLVETIEMRMGGKRE